MIFPTHQIWTPIKILLALLLAGCAAAPAGSTPTLTMPMLPTLTQTRPAPSPVPSQTASPTEAPSTAPAPRACSPLEGFDRAQLLAAVSNPFHPPPPGSDQPHAGVDLAVTAPGSKVAQAGHAVQAFFAGRVAAVVRDRFPFGNALIVETPLQDLALPAGFGVPTLAPTPAAIQALTCPAPAPTQSDFAAPRSLYILYAHLPAAPAFALGDALSCGQTLGQVGMSGNALNPHLHFETRLGPPGLSFASLAHYDVSASPQEMAAYCDWSVRGIFQLVDPLPWIELVK